MGQDSKIQWTDHTFNPWWGCTKVSPGCTNCYAEALDKRTGGKHWGPGVARRRTSAKNWLEPLKWERAAVASGVRARVFCASMADWLDDEVPAEWLADLLELIASTPHLDWLLLTKRPENWRERLEAIIAAEDARTATWSEKPAAVTAMLWLKGTVPENIWIGTTVEDQRRANERIPHLLGIPARVRFLSCEPLLESVDLAYTTFNGADSFGTLPGINWVIVGGESGPGARPFDLGWARDIVGQCRTAGVPVFVKQLGDRPVGKWDPDKGQILTPYWLPDRGGGNPNNWPESLRIREFPEVR